MVERAPGVDTSFSAEDLDNKENVEFENILERDFQPLGFVEQIIVELDPGCRNNEDRLSTIAISAWKKFYAAKWTEINLSRPELNQNSNSTKK